MAGGVRLMPFAKGRAGVPFPAKESGADVSSGVGASYDFTKNFGIRAEWERFKPVDNIDLLSVGLVYKF